MRAVKNVHFVRQPQGSGGEANEHESHESELCRGSPSIGLFRGGAPNEPCHPGISECGDVGLRGSDEDINVLRIMGDTSFSLSGLLAKGELTTRLADGPFMFANCVTSTNCRKCVRGSCVNGL